MRTELKGFVKVFWVDAEKPGGAELDDWLFRAGDLARRADVWRIGPLHMWGRATASRGVCEVRGRVAAEVWYRCSRCLCGVEDLVDAPLQEVFSRAPLSLEQQEADVVHSPGEAIELDAYAEQAIFVGLRAQVLCSPQCKGLCPVCGIDRNTSSCACELERLDPRWESLGEAMRRGGE